MSVEFEAADESIASDLRAGLSALGLRIDEEQKGQLLRYLALLEKWNRVYNLTAIREIRKMVSGHLLDSLAIVPHLQGRSVLDIGSGAGLPGIPIAIARTDLQVVLLDGNQKKVAFMRQALAELALRNASVVCERIERWQTQSKFDFIVSRAFAETAAFARQSRRLLAHGGVIAAMKGLHPHAEIEGLSEDFSTVKVVALRVPGLAAARHLALISPK